MKTQDRRDEQVTSQQPGRSKGISRLATAGAVLVVLLIVAASAFVFTQLSQHYGGQSPSSRLPPVGNWVQVLNGYTIASVVAADSTSSTLYACATRSQGNAGATGS